MSQQRITLFFPVLWREKRTPPAKCHFLKLPSSIRRRIYLEADLVVGETIYMNFWDSRGQSNFTWGTSSDFGDLLTLPLTLFSVCKKVHEETTQILYDENRFVVTRHGKRGGLQVLEKLGEETLAKIKFIAVRINISDRDRRCTHESWEYLTLWPHDNPLAHVSMSDIALISQWQHIFSLLSRCVLPGQLALYITCDCEDLQTAKAIAEPLMMLPTLRDSALRLGEAYDAEIQELAESTVRHLTNRPNLTVEPFQFSKLPKEIQLTILSYTDLVTSNEIKCNLNRMDFPAWCHRGISTGNSRINLPDCFCYSQHAAFNPRCHHDRKLGFPSALFLVSQHFLESAVDIFYGKNSFVASMMSNTTDGTYIVPIMDNFPEYALKSLTSLKLDFGPEIFEWNPSLINMFSPSVEGWKNWPKVLRLLSESSNLAILNLEIRFYESFYSNYRYGSTLTTDIAYEEKMWDIYQGMIQPVAILQGLKNLFVHLNWGTGSKGTGYKDDRNIYERRLEIMAMGPDYDAWQHGKIVRVDCSGSEY
jgi:hypothetical protein